jgi:hypothetical protein
VLGLSRQEKMILLFLLSMALLGGGVLFAKQYWPGFAPDLVISGPAK